MKLKKLLVLTIVSATMSLNAGMVASITGPNVLESEYDGKNVRGIIVDQDIDGDGIIDSKDDCLETIPCKGEGCIKEEPKVVPAPVVVLDSDNDGVIDSLDKCPQTPAGFQVNDLGCTELVDLNVQFDTNKYVIKNEYNEKLDAFVTFMKKFPTFKAQIQGHTDSRGTENSNDILSQNRANAVTSYLVEKGIEKDRLTSLGFGELSPISTNKTAEGRAINRRVIAVLEK